MQEQVIQSANFFKNTSNLLFQQIELGSIIDHADEVFKEKTYLERYKNLYRAASLASYFFQATSALFAFNFGQHVVASTLPQFGESFSLYAPYLLAALILIGIEVFKRLCFGSFMVVLIRSKVWSISLATLFINLLLIGVGVYSSTQGAMEFTQQQTDKSELIRTRYAITKDSTSNTFQKQIDTANIALTNFKKAVSWNGKINMAEKNTASTIGSLNQRLDRVQDEKAKTLASLESSLQNNLTENEKKTRQDTGIIFWIALIVELAGLLCIGYTYFFLSRVFIENQLLQVQNKTDESEINISDDFQQFEAEKNENEPAPANDLPQTGMVPPLENPFPSDLTGFLRKYEAVVKCLEQGLSNKQVAKRCKVSETTVHNVKRCLKNLGVGA